MEQDRAERLGEPACAAAGRLSRRRFIRSMAGFALSGAGLALLAGCGSRSAPAPAAQGTSLETATMRLPKNVSLCFAPQYLAEDLLRAKGFTDVHYVDKAPGDILPAVAAGEVDMAMGTASGAMLQADADDSLVMLAGIHVGCYELFANPSVHSLSDLKGKTVGVTALGSGRHIHLAAMAAYVGVDLNRDVTLVTDAPAEAIRLFSEGQIDAFMANPPEPQELRARGVGRVIVNTTTDRPWSQYFCCMLVANRGFVQQHPVATKRGLRAVLEAADICANEPERAARGVVDRGFTTNYGHALQMFKDVSYHRWRDYDPEDTVRFFSLRLHEVGMIKSSPDKIIAQGTDWRFFNELKQELKG
jgi:NitT/TauT family transport system substrate-binding protein